MPELRSAGYLGCSAAAGNERAADDEWAAGNERTANDEWAADDGRTADDECSADDEQEGVL